MRRDMDLLASILEEVEEINAGGPPKWEQRGLSVYDIEQAKTLGVDISTDEAVDQTHLERWEHICLAEEDGLLRISATYGDPDDSNAYRQIRGLTTRGHDALAALRSTSVREKIKERI